MINESCTKFNFVIGVYFADMSSKSANYCWPSHTNNIGLLMLCEVALGSPNELTRADYNAASLPTGKDSVKGLGRCVPNPKNKATLTDGTVVPMGPGIDSYFDQGMSRGLSLQYNEYIVYDVSQIKMRYLAKIKFNYK